MKALLIRRDGFEEVIERSDLPFPFLICEVANERVKFKFEGMDMVNKMAIYREE